MKSDHRHELKTNELADWITHLPNWVRENRTSLAAAAALILVALLVYFVSFYRREVVSLRNQTRLTSLVTQVPQQISSIARAAMQSTDQSYALLPVAQDLQDFAQKSSNGNMAALALIQRGAALRAELHYRLNEVGRDELVKQVGLAQASYQEAVDRNPSSPALAATARYGLGLCEEELGNFDKARELYREVAQKPEYAGTTGQAAAAYRLKVMDDYKTELVFQPAPKPVEPPAATIQIPPGAPSAPPAVPAPQGPMIGPSEAPKTDAAPAPAPQTPAPAPESAATPAGAPSTPDANAPKGN
jgi:tetratricopeptide (TPR) repeat protein